MTQYERGRRDAVNEIIRMMTNFWKDHYDFRETEICAKMERIRDKPVKTDESFIKAHIIDTERLLKMAKDHPLMSLSLKERLDSLKSKI